jgi:hypothetical protein
MARSLYRVFLYLVVNVMLGFAAFALGSLLTTLLRFTALRGESAIPAGADVVRGIVLASIGLVFFLALGGLFYWLIRRDVAQDPDAARGGVRAFFLNLAQGAAALVALFAGISFFQGIGQLSQAYTTDFSYAPDLSGPLAVTLVAAAVFAVEQAERGRGTPTAGAPIMFQRLHLYGVQLTVLIASIGTWISAVDESVRVVLANLNLIADPCYITRAPEPADQFVCQYASDLTGLWLAVLWTVALWVVYFWLVRGDTRSLLRVVAQFGGFLVGLVSILVGVERAVELGLRAAFGLETNLAIALAQFYDFIPALLFGAVALAAYGVWLERDSFHSPLGEQTTELTTLALVGITLGVPFYIAIVQLLNQLGESAFGGTPLSTSALAATLALLFTGLAHPFIAIELRRRTIGDAADGPRRGFVLAGVAVGAIACAIGGGIALYLVITALLGSPVGSDWPSNARLAAEVFFVGAYVVGMHLWRAIAERSFTARPGAAPTAAGQADSVDAILDELLAGKITRDQAAKRLRGALRADGQ